MKHKKHLFFDLDRTIWDFDKNAEETIVELYQEFNLNAVGIDSVEDFFDKYEEINEQCWEAYRNGELAKHQLRSIRFEKALAYFYVNDEVLAERLGLAYLQRCPLKTNLIDDSHKVLSSLQEKYQLHIITNGFEETQHIKLKTCNLNQYFDVIITSEKAKAKKPYPAIFDFAIDNANTTKFDAVMIGDDLGADILGAHEFGMDSIWFNQNKAQKKSLPSSSREINVLSELLPIFL
jgi:putative hydrolase of the HAD superfamily